jgi:hypothetical protein
VAEDVLAMRAELEAEAAAPKAEIDQGNVIEGTDFVRRYYLANRINERLQKGEPVHERDRTWATEYMRSPEYQDTREVFAANAQPQSA